MQTPDADVLVVGSLNADLVTRAHRLPADGETVHGTSYARLAGGKGLNQAVAAARSGARTAMLGCVGDDDNGAFLLGEASAAGVDLADVSRLDGVETGVALIMVGGDGANRIVVVAGANGHVTPSLLAGPAAADRLRSASVVLCQLETPLDGVQAALAAGRAAGAVTVLNPAPAAPLPPAVLAAVDWLIPNEFEAGLILDEPSLVLASVDDALAAARRLRALGPRGVVVTLGSRGAVAVGPDGEPLVLAPFPVTAVDTTAAGDAFCGTFAAGLAAGLAPEAALRRACAAGALTATAHGAVPSIPTAADVDALVSGAAPGAPGDRPVR